MYEIHNLMYFYHRIYPASGPCRNCNEPIYTVNLVELKYFVLYCYILYNMRE